MVNDEQLPQKESAAKVSKVDKLKDFSPHLKFEYELDEETGRKLMSKFLLSDGTEVVDQNAVEKFIKSFKKASGNENPEYALQVLLSIAAGMPHKAPEDRLNHVAIMLPLLKPQDEIEALLLGQFLALQEAGMRCLHQAQHQSSFFHEEKLFSIAGKLFGQANATMQTFEKRRLGGQQTVQVIHVRNEGQAIIAQNLSHSKGGGTQEKSMDEPHGKQ